MPDAPRMTGKTCLVTGATSGIGLWTAVGLAQLGADVFLVARSRQRAERASALIRRRSGSDPAGVFFADLSRLGEVRRLADEVGKTVPRLNVLVNNAGAFFLRRVETLESFERTFALNHLAYFQLALRLSDRLREAAPARVVNVASGSHWSARIDFDDLNLRRGYTGWRAYANSKLGNIWFTYSLARAVPASQLTANAMTPGWVATNFASNNFGVRPFLWMARLVGAKRPEEGADTVLYLCSSPEVEGLTGNYFEDRRAVRSSPTSYDPAAQNRIWELSAAACGLEGSFAST